jgi:hypothetical protein
MKRALTGARINRKAHTIGSAGAWRTFALIKRDIKLAWSSVEPLHGIFADADANRQKRTKAAKELGCNQSECRFQEVLFAIGRDKPTRKPAYRRRASRKVMPAR